MLRTSNTEGAVDSRDVPLCRAHCVPGPSCSLALLSRTGTRALSRLDAADNGSCCPPWLFALRAAIGRLDSSLSVLASLACSQLALQLWEPERVRVPRCQLVYAGRGSRGPPQTFYVSLDAGRDAAAFTE
jgi:hypothetical protein